MKLYKRISLLLSMGIMSIGLITFRFSPAEAGASDPISDVSSHPADEVVASPTPEPTPAPTATPTPEPNNLVECEEGSEIYELTKQYLEAKFACDKEAFAELATTTAEIDEEELQQVLSTITGVRDIRVYTKRGIKADDVTIDYVVYYTYMMDITTIDSSMISMDTFCVTKDNGKYKVFFGEVSDEVYDYVMGLRNDEDYRELADGVLQQMGQQTEEDNDLLAYWLKLYKKDLAPDGELIIPEDIEGTVG